MAAFGRYEIIEVLGQGGFATVHRAHDPVLDRDVAIKVLHGHLAGDEQVADRFVREGRALARIRHPNLVQVYDAGTLDGQPYIAMEYVDGRSLAAVSSGRQLPLAEAANIVGQVAGAIDAVHATGLIHRDIKPANIIVEPSGRAVLLDLGIARDMDSTGVTGTGLVVGTPGFLAPEQVDSSVFVGPGTDVYQLAATTYTLLAGRPPYEGDTAQILYAVAHKPPPDLGAVRPDLPYQVVAAVTRALAKDPSQRPQTATAFAEALTADATLIAALHGGTATTSATAAAETLVASPASVQQRTDPADDAGAREGAPVVAGGPRRPSKAILMGLGAVVALALVVGAALLLFDGSDDPTEAALDEDEETYDFGDIRPDGKEVEVELVDGAPAELAFRGPASGIVSFVVEDSTVGANYSVRDRRGNLVGAATWVGEKGGIVEPIELPEPGDYTLRIAATEGGTATIVMHEVPEPGDNTIEPGGEVELVAEVPGATDRVSFEAKSGQRFAISIPKATTGFNLVVSRPDDPGTRSAAQWIPEGGGFVDVFEARQEGALVIRADPPDVQSLRATIKLIEVGEEKSVALAFAAPMTFSTTTPGENARFTFSGEADQVVSVRTTRTQTGSQLRLREDGENRDIKVVWSPSPGGALLVATLPRAGEYVIIIDPVEDHLESGTVAIYDVTEPVSVAAVVGGGAVTVRTVAPGQVGAVTFAGSAGQLVTVRSRGQNGYFAAITAPNGDDARRRQWLPANSTIADLVLEQTGEYTILLESTEGSPASFTLEITES